MTAGANGGLGCSPCAGGAWQIRRNHGSKWIYPRWTSGHCDQKWGKVEGRHFFGAAFLRFPTSLCPGAVSSGWQKRCDPAVASGWGAGISRGDRRLDNRFLRGRCGKICWSRILTAVVDMLRGIRHTVFPALLTKICDLSEAGPAPVTGDDRAVDKGGLAAGQEQRRVSDVLRHPHFRRVGQQSAGAAKSELIGGRHYQGDVRQHAAGGDGVASDAIPNSTILAPNNFLVSAFAGTHTR